MKKLLAILGLTLTLGLATGCDEIEIEDISLGGLLRPVIVVNGPGYAEPVYYEEYEEVVVEEYWYDDYSFWP